MGALTADSGREFHSLIAEGKKEWRYPSVLVWGTRILLECPRLIRVFGVTSPGRGVMSIWQLMILCIITAFCVDLLSLSGGSFSFSRMAEALDVGLKSWVILRADLLWTFSSVSERFFW